MDHFGYVVVQGWSSKLIGDVIPSLGCDSLGRLECPTVVIGHATHADHSKQQAFLGLPVEDRRPFYYKVIAE